MRRVALLAAWLAICPALAQPPATGATAETAAQPVVAGKVELVEGEVRFLDRERRSRVPRVDDQILEGESIVTGAGGEVHLRMEDGGLIAVRPGTKMRITGFRAEGDANDRLVVGLLEGSFRSVTGWIAKFTRNNYTVRTPNATIGVRGTDHEPFQIPQGSALGEPGTYDRVNEGRTYIQTKYGTVQVERGRAGYAHFRRAERPRVLERVPAHFRPTRHEERIGRRYQEIQQRLQERREERRKFLQERRGKLDQKGEQRRDKAEQRREGLEKKRGERRDKAEQRREALEQKRTERDKRGEERKKEQEMRRRQLEEKHKDRSKDLEERRKGGHGKRDRDERERR
ncbi:MAG: FecR domain-containing protein [Burkholderiales bacterium]